MSSRLFVTILFAWFAAAQTPRPPVQLIWPVDGATVPYRPCIAGVVADETAPLFGIVHPLDVDTYWVQPPITPGPGGKFLSKIYVAEPGRRHFQNQTFEIRFAFHPKQKLWNGQLLGYWPDAEALSPVIRVTRRDTAPDGCDQVPDESRTPVAERSHPPELQPELVRPHVDVSRPPIIETARRGPVRDNVWRYGAAALFCWFLFTIRPERAKELIDRLLQWRASFWQNLARASRGSVSKVVGLYKKLRDDGKATRARLWAAKGFQGTFARYWLYLLLCPVLAVTSVFATGAEAYVLHTRLSLILPAAMNAPSSLFDAVSDGTLSASSPGATVSRENTAEPDPGAPVPGGALYRLVKEIWLFFLRQGLWFIAIGLVALQAAAGVILLLEMRGIEPLEISPWRLLRQRPLPFCCFLVLNLALALLAALGGAEYSPGSIGWVIPASIAAALALVLPWLATFMVHYVLETASDCLGPVTAVLLALAGFMLAILLQTGWTILLVILVGALAASFVCSCLAGGVVVIFLGTSVLFAEAVPRVYMSICRELEKWRDRQPVRWRPAAATALGVLSVAVYFFVSK